MTVYGTFKLRTLVLLARDEVTITVLLYYVLNLCIRDVLLDVAAVCVYVQCTMSCMCGCECVLCCVVLFVSYCPYV